MNRVTQGDCLEVMKQIPDKSIDMILCDLPYGKTICKWDSIIPFAPLWEQYERVIKDHGAIVLTANQPFTTKLISSNLKLFRYCWIWDKLHHSNPLIAKIQPLRVYEDICVFYKKKCTYNPQGVIKVNLAKKSPKSNTFRTPKRENYIQDQTGYPTNILRFPKDTKHYHPTQKPVTLFEYLIKTYTNVGEVVLDNCIGSGTTGVAALNTGRSFIGIEKDPEFVEIASRRIEESFDSKTHK